MSRRKGRLGWWGALAATIVLCAALPGSAQERERGQGRGRGGFGGPMQASKAQLLQIEQVQQELKLSDEQKQKIEQISEDYQAARREAFQGGPGQEAFAQMREASQQADRKIAEVLQDEQSQRLEEIRLQVTGPSILAFDRELAEKLNVTRDQRQKAREILEAQGEKTREAFRNAEGEGRERFAAAAPELEKIRKETDEQLVAVLTDEQKQQWKEMTGEPLELDRRQLFRGFGGGRSRGSR